MVGTKCLGEDTRADTYGVADGNFLCQIQNLDNFKIFPHSEYYLQRKLLQGPPPSKGLGYYLWSRASKSSLPCPLTKYSN